MLKRNKSFFRDELGFASRGGCVTFCRDEYFRLSRYPLPVDANVQKDGPWGKLIVDNLFGNIHSAGYLE